MFSQKFFTPKLLLFFTGLLKEKLNLPFIKIKVYINFLSFFIVAYKLHYIKLTVKFIEKWLKLRYLILN